jgi:UDP-N-acetylmuramoyl-tripeptide--D-alanyl-D-alanine ligase
LAGKLVGSLVGSLIGPLIGPLIGQRRRHVVIALTLAELAELAGGTLSPQAEPRAVVDGPVVADSRRVSAGSLFVAVPGEHVDGHGFAAAAMAAGAVAILASKPVDAPAVLVDDTVPALGRLANRYLGRVPARIVAITGSSGKTSTKDLAAQLLSSLGPTVAPEGSFNTEVGVPLTILRADADTRFLALEMSARGLGHIKYLCEIAPPQIAAVLNVGAAHIGEFGSREVVAQAKGEIIEALPADGVAILNADDPLVAAMRPRTIARVVTFGTSPDVDVRASRITLDDLARPTFCLHSKQDSVEVTLSLHGAHHVLNALAAAAVALESGMTLTDIAKRLAAAVPVSHWRMELQTRADGVTVVNDAYNANPESMGAALAALSSIGRGSHDATAGNARRTWAVLGQMAELGVHASAAHRQVGAGVAAAGIDRLVVVGAGAAEIADGARGEGFSSSGIACVDDVDAALTLLRGEVGSGDVVLVKASRSANLQRIAEGLLADSLPADAGAGA